MKLIKRHHYIHLASQNNSFAPKPKMDIKYIITSKFKSLFNQEPLLVASPGRINLIGEHTDYNDGFVLPAAIDKYIYIASQKRSDNEIHIYSINYEELFVGNYNELKPSGKLWPDYLLGVVDELKKAGYETGGFNAVFDGDIPQGGGLSSSAALECATAFSLNQLFNLELQKLEIVKIAQAAENNFVGLKCGIMDQFASAFGKDKHLIKLDCRSLDYEYIPFKNHDVKIVLFDTGVKHTLASSAYNERRLQCEQGVKWIKAYHPEVESLRDVSVDMLVNYVRIKDEVIFDRCDFVVKEIARLQNACNDLLHNDFEQFGKRMFETHEGLSKDYAVSCDELDFLVDAVKNNPNVLGARMMGGGFGGCTINLIKADAVDEIIKEISTKYKNYKGFEPKIYHANLSDGTHSIEKEEIVKG